MIAKLAFLTTPSPGIFMLNFQEEGGELQQVEISKAHLANIIIDGTSLALRDDRSVSNRVPAASRIEIDGPDLT